MRRTSFAGLLFCIAAAGCSHGQESLCPRHIETPKYPPIARTAHVMGMVSLAVTIDADGNVKHVDATADDPWLQAHPMLQKYAVENMQHWTFAKPLSAPHIQIISYDYEFDGSLPPAGGPSSLPFVTEVTYDLPDRVTILANATIVDVSTSRTPN